MVSFDVVSLFTNVPLEEAVNIIIKRIYDKNKINTNKTGNETIIILLH